MLSPASANTNRKAYPRKAQRSTFQKNKACFGGEGMINQPPAGSAGIKAVLQTR